MFLFFLGFETSRIRFELGGGALLLFEDVRTECLCCLVFYPPFSFVFLGLPQVKYFPPTFFSFILLSSFLLLYVVWEGILVHTECSYN